ncbi:MAG: HAD hydrolase-like protein [Bacteroidaceae bacterium]|nr:HAD hydrolase-like protein [Bacteroidaceae bacterium]
MDGVLFDSMKNHARCWHETMAHFGLDLPEWEAYMHEGRTGAGTINLVSMRQRGHEATEEEIHNIYKYKSELFNQCPKAERMPGAYELLVKVKASGVVPMVVTGSGQVTLLDRLNRNFPDIFKKELMVTAFDVKYGKPNPEPYLMGMEKFRKAPQPPKGEGDLSAGSFIVVENAPLGVQAGVAAGVFTIAVNTGPLPDEALLSQGANLLFHSMQELCDEWEVLVGELKNL